MLDRTDFTSWQRIHLYCRGKENGVNILKSINEGPFQMGTFRETLAEGNECALHLGPELPLVYSDLSPEDKERYNAGIRATNILLQGLPKYIYTLINHYTDAKDIWDNVKMLLEGETIHDYYVRFAKLINDTRNIKMTMSRMQLNLKFVNNMLSEWGRFVTAVKLNRGLRDSNYDQLYTYLKQHDAHANENKMMLDRFTQHTNRGQGNNARGAGAAGYEGAQNRVGNANPGQASQIKCYNCNGISHIARNCTQPKQPQNSEYFKDKMLRMQAQENIVALDEEQLLFIAGGQDNVVDEDVDEKPVQDLALNVDNVFQADDYHVYDEAGPSYDSDILSEVHDHDHYQDAVCEHHEAHEMHDDVQTNYVVDSHADYTSDSNMIPYDQYKENKYLEEFLDMKSLKEKVKDKLYKQDQSLQTVHMLCKPKPYYDEQRKVAIGYKNPLCVTHAKQVQPALYNGHEIIKINHVLAIVHNSEDTLEIAEITIKKMNEKMKDPECVKKKVKIAPHDYSKENYLATFTPQTQLTPEQIFWSKDLIKMKTEALKEQTLTSRPIKELTLFSEFEKTYKKRTTPTGLTKGERGFEQTKESYLTEYDEIERKNLLIANDNLNAYCLSKDVFYIATNSELTVFRFNEMHDAHTIVQARCLELEAELSKLHDKVQKDDHTKLVKHFSNLEDHVKSKGITPGRYAIDVEPIPPRNRNNREVHLDYLKHLKESVETLCEIVEEAKAERPLDRSLASTCRKKQVTFEDQCETSNSKTYKHVGQLNIQKTNVHVPLSTGVNNCTDASGSHPRSNTKKNRISPAKSINKMKVEVHPRTNQSSLKTLNRVDSSISSKRTVINSNSHSVCQTCNKCLISANHDVCVVDYLHSVNASPSVNNVVCKVKQVWKPKQVRQIWKATGKVLTSVGYQWRPTGRIFTLGEQCPLTRLTKPKVVPAKQTENVSTSKSVLTQKPLTRYQPRNQQYQAVPICLPTSSENQAIACANQQEPNQNWGSNSPSSSIFKCRFGNDHFGASMGYRDYVIGDSVISWVYYVEGLGHNLFSFRQFCDSDLEVAFIKHSCYVQDTDGVELIKGSRGSNIYTISVEDMMKSSLICLLSKASKNKSWLWHHRLNHVNFGTINDLAKKNLVRGLPRLKFEKDHICSACQLGKSKKHTHSPKTENTNLEVLNTLHMDLCGPMQFVNQILTQYYEIVDIFHQTSVLRTPQQNGVVERRNHTLVKVAMTMLIFSKAPMFLWAEAVAATCYT
ncbi:retrovirus-related pol polyprotein from transposon TNT 1-94 [Tanacetum coccineum]